MAYQITDEHDTPRITPAVQWLIALNVAVYFLQLTIVPEAKMRAALGFEVGALAERPWTVITYMFVHGGFWHLAVNMYGLWLFGSRVERAWSPGSFVRYYLLCGLGGWLAHMMFFRQYGLVGASAGVFGVMLAYAMRWPDDEVLLYFFIPLKIKWAVMLYGGLSLVLGMTSGGAGGVAHFAHLGGLATGWLYLRWIQGAPGLDRLRHRMSQVPDAPDEPPRAVPRARPRERERPAEVDEIISRSNALTANKRAGSPTLVSKVGQAKSDALNDVLDKISRQGIESLTGDERQLLEEMSRRLRNS
ncbi:MAG TPA: rhomboid family intramembrane serine protease [Gemmatimonadaceae bacterium]|nr:rhomboid family intramembrane serine protease [Gemmatimonadaceae bacterium]